MGQRRRSGTTWQVLVIDEHPLIIDGIRLAVEAQPGLAIAGTATNATPATLELLTSRVAHVDVVVGELHLQEGPLLEVAAWLRTSWPGLRTLVFTAVPVGPAALGAFREGAQGYLTKRATADELAAAIRTVASGRRYVPDGLAELLIDDLSAPVVLTRREQQVLDLLVEGLRVVDIAVKLSLSPATISTYKSRLHRKLGAPSLADLIRYAEAGNVAGYGAAQPSAAHDAPFGVLRSNVG